MISGSTCKRSAEVFDVIIDQQSSFAGDQSIFAFDAPLSPLQDAVPGNDQGIREVEVVAGSATTAISIAGSIDS